jgi:hypothetical protein
MSGKLRIFLSSTCNDLAVERQRLKERILQLGHECIRNEEDFPVGDRPDSMSVCRYNIEHNSDILILVIGSKKGWVDPETGKSAVRIEFETARDNLIDMMVIIKREVWNAFGRWQTDPTLDFSAIVDSNDIFELIRDATHNSQDFINTFDTTDELIGIVSNQLSSFFRSLVLRKKEGKLKPLSAFLNESEELQGMVSIQPKHWYIRAMELLLRSRAGTYAEQMKGINNGSYYQPARYLSTLEFIPWWYAKFMDMTPMLKVLSSVIENSLNNLTVEGKKDPKPLVIKEAIEQLAAAMRSLFNWQRDFYFIIVPEDCKPTANASKSIFHEVLERLGALADDLNKIWNLPEPDGTHKLTINFGDGTELSKAYETYKELIQKRREEIPDEFFTAFE